MLSIRAATVNDVALLKALIFETGGVRTETGPSGDFRGGPGEEDGFGPQPKFRALIAEWGGQAAGYALFFWLLPTQLGRASRAVPGRICLYGRPFAARESARRC